MHSCCFWLVVTLIFVLIRMAPGDPAEFLVPPTATAATPRGCAPTSGSTARSRSNMHAGPERWSGGTSARASQSRQPVSRALLDARPVSIALGGISLLLTFLIGVPLGMFQAAQARPRARPA